MSLNFSEIWLSFYDQANVTLAQVVADLDSSSSILMLTRDFFVTFFGPQGFVPLNTTYSMEPQNQVVDAGLKDIVTWLIENVEEEVHQVCPQCVFNLPPPMFANSTTNNTNSSGSLPNNTNSSNLTVPPVALWWPGNYSLPANCSYADPNNSSVFCNQGVLRRVTYTFAEMNEFYKLDLSNVCSDAQVEFNSCQSNSVITNPNVCFPLFLFN
jgi:hypothetical protein